MRDAMLTASVVGSGPNGLTAAILLARAGFKTTIHEAEPQFGGGLRSAELTLPGYTHDVCSAVHPLAACSPVFATVPLAEHGLKWIHSPVPMAHPISADRCAVLHHSLARTMEGLGKDAASYRWAVEPLVSKWDVLVKDLLAPLHFPADPVLFARFGLLAILSARQAVNLCFNTPEAKALFAGASAHSILPLEEQSSAAIGWVLMAAAHAVGWPIPRGGSQSIANALASYFQSIGGTLVTGARISNLRDLPPDGPILCDVGPRQLLQISGDSFPTSFAKKLEAYRYGPGAFKLDWALSAPIPWKATACRQAGTVHIGGTLRRSCRRPASPMGGRLC